MQQESAELIGLKVLAWLAAEEEIFPVFLGASGISTQELMARASESEILSAVLDFVTMDDEWVKACCQSTGLDPHDPMRARQALPGGAQIHWT
ncbi:MAG: DUF3572 domain-containing protein [Rhodobacteraceae bacterium]|uniref:DUF3572 domain-containing protein n=1 Tax=Celeribacter sp. HF31 TaxID=2721558 RepID=UPI0014314058|nr:DUF3572 domain-containing protein [Celeribacter sp. HF31]NIY78207.1 DUF3572 domain-containing protein [Celeribacter sp. HF31]NVK46573.1 DUF3572 domain-containing protein [Paracoccaceae bacterium]